MSKIEKVCSTCKHEPRDENCLGCTFDWKNANGNTHWEPQEPFINKPCISDGVCHEDKINVFEKIKAKIEQDAFNDVNGSKYISVNRVNQIIDKYMKESEDAE